MKHTQSLVQMFRTHVDASPDAVLLHYQNATYSYQDCDALSHSIIALLQNYDVRRGDSVCIANHKTVYGYAAMLACLKMGVAYCNCDYLNAPQRLAQMIKVVTPKLMLRDGEAVMWDEVASSLGIESLCLNSVESVTDVEYAPAQEDDCAYIMFTSGSTGTPKGVMISQKNVAAFVTWIRERFAVCSKSRFSQVNPLYFDNSVFDFYGAIFNGASLIPVDVQLEAPHKPLSILAQLHCTHLFAVPSMILYWQRLRCFASIALPDLKYLIFGGEAFPKPALFDLKQQLKFGQLVSVYGPTECTCICSSYTVSEDDFADLTSFLPLGPLNPGFSGEIVEGELVLHGANVGMGYRHDLTNTSLAWRAGYPTGDLVECVDGIYYFKGRCDNQIKHMGYRIELEEIEAVLMTLPGVSQALVTYKKQAVGGEFTAHLQGDSAIDIEGYKQKLPNYMWPHNIVWYAQLPKNANGKVSRKDLIS